MGMGRKSWQKPTDPCEGFLAPLMMLQSANCLHAAPAERWLPACTSLSPDTQMVVGMVGGGPHVTFAGEKEAAERSKPCVGRPQTSAPSLYPVARLVLAKPRGWLCSNRFLPLCPIIQLEFPQL